MIFRKNETALRRAFTLCLGGLTAAGCAAANEDNCSDTPGVICTWAGTGKEAYDGDGHALTESSFYWPVDLTIDDELGTYVLDWNNHKVRHLKDDDTFETVIGTDFVGDGPYDLSDLKAPGAIGTDVNLNHPTQLVPMHDGTLTLVSWHNHKLRTYDPQTGLVLVACGGAAGFGGDGGPAAMAKLNQPTQLVVSDNGTQYLIDQRNQVVRMIDPEGIISTLAGTPTMAGFEGDGGPANECKLSFPTGPNPDPGGGLVLDKEEHYLYVSDTLNHRIRRIDLETKEIETIAGTGEKGFSGDGGKATKAKLDFPRKLTFGPDGHLYFGDQNNNRIRAIDLKKGTITTVAGNGAKEFDGDGVPPKEAALNRPTGVTFDKHGVMYIVDTFNSRIRRVVPEETGSAK
jgi:DNA-binding beta-propeller fold protein YncE